MLQLLLLMLLYLLLLICTISSYSMNNKATDTAKSVSSAVDVEVVPSAVFFICCCWNNSRNYTKSLYKSNIIIELLMIWKLFNLSLQILPNQQQQKHQKLQQCQFLWFISSYNNRKCKNNCNNFHINSRCSHIKKTQWQQPKELKQQQLEHHVLQYCL